jgi:hypothetical protein
MLQGVQTKGGQGRRIFVAEYAENAAFFPEAIILAGPAPDGRSDPSLTLRSIHGGLLLRPEQQRYPGTAIGLNCESSRRTPDIGQLSRACHRPPPPAAMIVYESPLLLFEAR